MKSKKRKKRNTTSNIKKDVQADRSRKRRIIIALLLMVFVGIIFTASVYAWFTADKVVTIDMVDVHASTASGLTISKDAIDWKGSLTNEDLFNAYLTYPGARNQIPQDTGVIEPVSTVGRVINGDLDMYYGYISAASSGDLILISHKTQEEENTTKEGKFVVFDAFLKTNLTTNIYLGKDSSVIVKNGTVATGTENAIRVAFVKEGNVSSPTDVSGAQRLRGGTEAIIWEPNNDAHNKYAIESTRYMYGVDIGPNTVIGSYYGVHSTIPESDAVSITSTNPAYFSLVTPTFSSGTGGLTQNQSLGLFQAGITKLRIYLWLEGQDYDCEDNSSGGSISFNLTFTLNERD